MRKILLNMAAIAFWVGVWQISAMLVNRNLLLKIPLPAETLKALLDNIGTAEFRQAVETSLLNITVGFAGAVAVGLLFGVASGSMHFFRILTSPVIHLIRSVPVAAFIFLAWIWIPNRILPAFISFLMVFPIVWNQAEAGILLVDSEILEMAKVMRLGKIKTMLHIKLPSIIPSFRAACITGLGFAWKSGVAAEIICSPTGSIGSLLSGAKQNIDYPGVFAITLTIVFLSLLLENIIKLLWRDKSYDKH